MATWERELLRLLDSEKELLSTLCECAEEKTPMLVKGNVDGISRMINREQPLSLRCQAAEAERAALLEQNRLKGKTLRELCLVADNQYKGLLEMRFKELVAVVKRLRKRNELNSQLTRSRLEFYGKLRALVSRPAYGYDGLAQQYSRAGRGIIDRKV